MEAHTLSPNELRVIIALIGAVILALIYVFGRPKKPEQGRRTQVRGEAGERVEPTLGDADAEPPPADGLDPALRGELERLGEAIAEQRGETDTTASRTPPRSHVGVRADEPIERIVTLFIVPRGGQEFHGSDLVVAAEKCGLEFGAMGIFHRLVDGKPEAGPVFSLASMVKPGSFDMTRIDRLTIPGVSLFLTLPGPLPALDAWETMLPTAQRLAELLGGALLDEERNALGRQRIAHLRDELRVWDRRQESQKIRPGW